MSKKPRRDSAKPRERSGTSSDRSEFDRFERLTKRLLSVPKKEIEKEKKRKAG